MRNILSPDKKNSYRLEQQTYLHTLPQFSGSSAKTLLVLTNSHSCEFEQCGMDLQKVAYMIS